MKTNLVHSVMWFAYYFIGGVYIQSQLRPIYKNLHLSLLGFSLFFTLGGLIGYMITVKTAPIEDRTYAAQVTTGAIFMILVIPISTYIYREELTMILNYLRTNEPKERSSDFEHHLNINNSSLSNKTPNFNTFNIFSWWFFFLHLVLPFLYVAILVFDVFFFCENEFSYRNSRHHIFVIPFLDRIPSKTSYAAIFTLEATVNYIISELIHVQSSLVLIATRELKNIVTNHCDRMEYLTRLFEDEFEKQYEDFTSLHDWFNKNLINWIVQHREFLRITKPFRSYVAMYGSLALTLCSLTQISVVFLFLRSNSEMILKIRFLILVLLVSLTFYTFCEIGTLFDEMNESSIYHIYSLPWYYMPITIRNTIHIWQIQTSQGSSIKGYKVYILNRLFYPSLLKTAYSFGNILRQCA